MGKQRAKKKPSSFRDRRSQLSTVAFGKAQTSAGGLVFDEANDHCLPDRSRAKFCKVQQSLFARTQRFRRSVWRKFCPRGIMIGFAGRPIGRAEESVGGIRERCHQIRFMLRG